MTADSPLSRAEPSRAEPSEPLLPLCHCTYGGWLGAVSSADLSPRVKCRSRQLARDSVIFTRKCQFSWKVFVFRESDIFYNFLTTLFLLASKANDLRTGLYSQLPEV